MANILIVDDDPVLQKYLEIQLSKHGYKVTPLVGGEEIENVLQKQQIDLIILDIMLAGRDGFYWLSWLQLHHSNIDTIMLSAKNSAKDRVRGLELGAIDYLPKPFNIRELQIRMENIFQRRANKIDSLIHFGDYIFDNQSCVLTKQDIGVNLTNREAELLAILCQYKDEIVTRDQIAQVLNGNEHSPLDRRIDVHINRLRNKIEKNPSSPEYIRTIWGKGYRFITQPIHH